MAVLDIKGHAMAITMRGKFRKTTYVNPKKPHQSAGYWPELKSGVYQMRRRKHGLICVVEKYYEPSNQSQPAKVARQNVFRDAVHAWQALTTEQKKFYNKLAIGYRYFGYNLFIKKYLKSH